MNVRPIHDSRASLDALELRACNPVFETLCAQLLLELALDEIPGVLILTTHKDNTTPLTTRGLPAFEAIASDYLCIGYVRMGGVWKCPAMLRTG